MPTRALETTAFVNADLRKAVPSNNAEVLLPDNDVTTSNIAPPPVGGSMADRTLATMQQPARPGIAPRKALDVSLLNDIRPSMMARRGLSTTSFAPPDPPPSAPSTRRSSQRTEPSATSARPNQPHLSAELSALVSKLIYADESEAASSPSQSAALLAKPTGVPTQCGPAVPGADLSAEAVAARLLSADFGTQFGAALSAELERPLWHSPPDIAVALVTAGDSPEELERRLGILEGLFKAGFVAPEEYVRRRTALELAVAACRHRDDDQSPLRRAVLAAAGELLTVEYFPPTAAHIPQFVGFDEIGGAATAAADASRRRRLRGVVQAAGRMAEKGKSRSVRVFVSSTFRDMGSEREHLMKRTFPKLRKFAAERGVFLTAVDLRWGITAEQAQRGDTIKLCLREVDRCRPYFLCLLGDRYGWAQPEGYAGDGGGGADAALDRCFAAAFAEFPWLRTLRDRSVTELEIRHGVLNHPTDDAIAHAVFCMRQQPVSTSSTPGEPRLERLKNELMSLSGAKVHHYTHAEALGEAVLAEFQRMLEGDFPVEDVPSPLQHERSAHDAFAAVRARVYIGRSHYFDQINAHLTASKMRANAPLVVVGESGSGKSALVANWAVGYKASHESELVVTHYIGSTSASTDLGRMLVRIMGEIKAHYAIERDVPTEAAKAAEKFAEWLSDAATRGGMVLVLDALNQLDDRDNAHSLNWLPHTLPSNVQVVLSTLPGKCQQVAEQRKWPTLRVQPLSADERGLLVEEYLAIYGKSLPADQLRRVVTAPQCGNPLFLRTLLDELRVFGSFEALDSALQRYLTAASPAELFALVFARLEEDLRCAGAATGDVVGDVLALLWVSRRGLTEAELLDLTAIAPSTWAPLYAALEEALLSRAGFLTFFHDYMRQAVESRYLLRGNRYAHYRHWLIRHFDAGGAGADSATEARKLEEIPFQQYMAADWQGLARYIVANFEKLFVPEYKFDLYRYWRAAAQHVDIEALLADRIVQFERTAGEARVGEVVTLLGNVGKFLQDIGSYDSAERALTRALEFAESAYGRTDPAHPEITDKLDQLGYLKRLKGEFRAAEPLCTRALELRERAFGPTHPLTAHSLNALAILYRLMGKYDRAEPLYIRALLLREQIFGSVHEEVAHSLNSLGCLNQDMGRHAEAEQFFKRAIAMREHLCGPHHPDVAMSLGNLAGLYLDQTRYEQAETLYKRALAIYQDVFGETHPNVAQTLNSLAGVAQETARYDEAEKLYRRTLDIKQQLLGNKHPDLALTLNDLAVLYARQDRYDEAEKLYTQALQIRKEMLGSEHPDYAQSLNNLGSLYQDIKQYDKALKLFKEALEVLTRVFGDEHMDVASTLTLLGGVYQFLGRYDEAVPLYQRALGVFEKLLGPVHADVAVTLNDLAVLQFNRKRYDEAEELYKRALETYEKVFGSVHPDVAQALTNLGSFYLQRKEPEQAKPLLERAVSIYTSVFGPSHSKTTTVAALVPK